jgi:hypothetical protein
VNTYKEGKRIILIIIIRELKYKATLPGEYMHLKTSSGITAPATCQSRHNVGKGTYKLAHLKNETTTNESRK